MKKFLLGLYAIATFGSCVSTRGIKQPEPKVVVVVNSTESPKDSIPLPTVRVHHVDLDTFGITKHPKARPLSAFSRPRAKVTFTTSATTYPAPANIAMTATATQPGGGIVRVDFMNGAVVVASDAISPYSGTWSNVPAGTYNLIARSLGTDNVFTYSNSITVTVSGIAPPPPPANIPPTINLTSPANNSIFIGNPAAFSVSFTGGDVDGTVVQTELFVNGASAGVQSGSNVTFNLSKTPATYTIFGRSTDNVGAITNSSTISVVVNAPAPPPTTNLPPVTNITSPATGASYTGNPALFNVAVAGSDPDGSIVQTDLVVNGTIVASSGLGNVTFALSKVPGTYGIHTVATDNGGATSTSSTVTVTVVAPVVTTNQPPVIAITTPATGTNYPISPSTIPVTFTQSDPDGTVVQFQLFINGVFAGGADGTSPLNFSISKTTGTYTIYGTSKDNLGALTTSNSITVTVGSTPPPVTTNQNPTVSITAPASGTTYTGNPSTFNVVVADSDPDGTISKTELYVNSILYSTQNIANPTFAVTKAPGTYTIYAKAYDNSTGATNSASKTITVVAPTTNIAPTIALSSPANNTTYTGNPATFGVTFNSSDADGTVSETDLYVNGSLTATSTGGGVITFTLTKAPGTYTIYGKAIDNSGTATNSSTITVTVVAPPPPPPAGNIAPTVSITSPPSGSSYVERTLINVDITYADADGTVVATDLYANGVLQNHNYNSSTQQYLLNQFVMNSSAGTYNVVAKATDNSGAVTTSAPITITYTSAPPPPPPPPTSGVARVYTNCLYLNFNGGTYTGTQWNVTTFSSSSLTATEQDNVVQSVQNDYAFGQLLVTRDVTVYNTYAANHRYQTNITTTSAWYPNVGGVSYTGSFSWADGTPNWAFSDKLNYSTKMVGECCSHEFGHAVGLGHSNDYGTACSVIGTYYAGYGTNPIGFAPIMGNSYYKTLSLFDDGEPFINTGCSAAARSPFATMIGYIGQQPDDFPNNLTVTPTNAFPITGSIETRDDIDALAVPIGSISVMPFTNDKGEDPDLHLRVDFYNSSKVFVASYSNDGALGVTFNSTGGYILVTTRANVVHSTYGMVGKYRVYLSTGGKYYPKITVGDHLVPLHPKKNDGLRAPKRF